MSEADNLTQEGGKELRAGGNLEGATALASPLKAILRPINSFMAMETSGGIVLLVATIAALLWANLSHDTYEGFWETKASLGIGSWLMEMSLREWVNDGLMTIFFLQVGMEIKRELQVGELSEFQQAILPVVAAAGGMMAPALIFTLFAHGTEFAHGWGIPTATDIAFAVGALTLAGKHVPASLKIFLLALAIADDLGAVLVIALFYGGQTNWGALLGAAAVFGFLLYSNKLGIRSLLWYLIWGVVLWFFVHASGVHSTIAGVLLALTIPCWSRFSLGRFRKTIVNVADYIDDRRHPQEGILADSKLVGAIDVVSQSAALAQPALHTLESTLNNWVSMCIMPIFALANAGVAINSLGMDVLTSPLSHGIACGLIFGKPIGIVCGAWLIIKLGLAKMPRNSTWAQMWGVGMMGGVGFTMALFVSGLSVNDAHHLDIARISILAASTCAAVLGCITLRMLPTVNTASKKEAKEVPANFKVKHKKN